MISWSDELIGVCERGLWGSTKTRMVVEVCLLHRHAPSCLKIFEKHFSPPSASHTTVSRQSDLGSVDLFCLTFPYKLFSCVLSLGLVPHTTISPSYFLFLLSQVILLANHYPLTSSIITYVFFWMM